MSTKPGVNHVPSGVAPKQTKTIKMINKKRLFYFRNMNCKLNKLYSFYQIVNMNIRPIVAKYGQYKNRV